MSRQGTAWSVKGVDQATRDIARRASQSAGLTIGEWIDHAIRADAAARGEPPAEIGGEQAVGRPGPNPAPGRVSLSTVDALAARLDAADARFDAAMRPIAYALQDIAERLVALEQRTAEPALAPPVPEEGEPEQGEPGEGEPWEGEQESLAPSLQHHAAADDTAAPDTAWDERAWNETSEVSTGTSPENATPVETSIAAHEAAVPAREGRPLPDAPPADWEPVVWIRRADLARDAEAMRGPARQQGEEASDEAADRRAIPPEQEPDLTVAASGPAPLLDNEFDAIRFDEPEEPAQSGEPAGTDAEEEPPARPEPVRPEPVRPEPTPPTGDIPAPTDFQDTVPAWLTRGRSEPEPTAEPGSDAGPDSGPEPLPPVPTEAVARQVRFEEAVRRRPPVRRPRRWPIAAAIVLVLFAGGAAAWWAVSGGGTPTVQGVQARLTATAEQLRSGAEATYRTAAAELARWREQLFPSGPEAEPRAPVAEAPPPEAPVTAVPPVAEIPTSVVPSRDPADAERQSDTPAADSMPAAEPAPQPAPSRPRASVPSAGEPRAPQPAPAPESSTARQPTAQPAAPATPSADASKPDPSPPPAPPLLRQPSPGGEDQTAAVPPSGAEPAQPDDGVDLLAQARRGDPRAQYLLATRLAAAAEPDYTQAANWFREAAIQGVANAQYNLGVLYERGLGVPQDDTRALLWYHSAAEQGHPLAQYNLGVLYSAGRGIPLSYVEAARWFGQAAEQGVPAAVYNLSVLTEGGLGLARDPAEAERLLRRAAELGHPKARQRLQAGGASADAATMDDTASTATDAVAAEDVVTIQRGLARLGLYDGPVDGIAGPRTREAISRYQQREGLPVTGLPSNSLKQRLNPPRSAG